MIDKIGGAAFVAWVLWVFASGCMAAAGIVLANGHPWYLLLIFCFGAAWLRAERDRVLIRRERDRIRAKTLGALRSARRGGGVHRGE